MPACCGMRLSRIDLTCAAAGRRADRMLPLYNLDRAQVCTAPRCKRSLSAPLLMCIVVQVGECALPGDVFDLPVRVDLLHRVVRWQRAKKQQVRGASTESSGSSPRVNLYALQGTHSVKTRAEVRGGGRKPHPQKGTGRARAGTIRAPQVLRRLLHCKPAWWCSDTGPATVEGRRHCSRPCGAIARAQAQPQGQAAGPAQRSLGTPVACAAITHALGSAEHIPPRRPRRQKVA